MKQYLDCRLLQQTLHLTGMWWELQHSMPWGGQREEQEVWTALAMGLPVDKVGLVDKGCSCA